LSDAKKNYHSRNSETSLKLWQAEKIGELPFVSVFDYCHVQRATLPYLYR
jgi:hypothetical protein